MMDADTTRARAQAQNLADKLLAHKQNRAQEEITDLAQRLGLDEAVPGLWYATTEQLLQLAVVVAAAEREACAQSVADVLVHDIGHPYTAFKTQELCIDAIRARGGNV